jgi:hypothetical protein
MRGLYGQQFYAREVIMRKFAIGLLVIVVLTTGFGCSTHSRTVTTETRDYPAGVDRRTETTTETQSESGGVLSSTVDVVGEVIALPFRAVGGLIRGIF